MTKPDLSELYADGRGLAVDISGCHYYAENGLPMEIHEVTALLDSSTDDMECLQLMDDRTENAAEHYDDVSRSVILTGQ